MLKYKSKIETQVTLLAVINDVGSSMGLWLGISVFSIFEAISKVLWRRSLNIKSCFVLGSICPFFRCLIQSYVSGVLPKHRSRDWDPEKNCPCFPSSICCGSQSCCWHSIYHTDRLTFHCKLSVSSDWI